MDIDPAMTQDVIGLGSRLNDAVLRNSASTVRKKIDTIKAKGDQREIIQELEEIIDDLIDDKNELRHIAEAYKETFIAQNISQAEIEYITGNVVPVLRKLIELGSDNQDGSTTANATNMEQTLEVLTPILSVQTLTVLQLLGFNFKQAIGEPLTLLLRQFITSKAPVDLQSDAEQAKLNAAFSLEIAKIVQDQEATERWLRLNGR